VIGRVKNVSTFSRFSLSLVEFSAIWSIRAPPVVLPVEFFARIRTHVRIDGSRHRYTAT
jgi:hypothetical protein